MTSRKINNIFGDIWELQFAGTLGQLKASGSFSAELGAVANYRQL